MPDPPSSWVRQRPPSRRALPIFRLNHARKLCCADLTALTGPRTNSLWSGQAKRSSPHPAPNRGIQSRCAHKEHASQERRSHPEPKHSRLPYHARPHGYWHNVPSMERPARRQIRRRRQPMGRAKLAVAPAARRLQDPAVSRRRKHRSWPLLRRTRSTRKDRAGRLTSIKVELAFGP